MPGIKHDVGYRHVRDKFTHAGLTRAASDLVRAPRIAECPVQMEAQVVGLHPLVDRDDPEGAGAVVAVAVVAGCTSTPRCAWTGMSSASTRTAGGRWS